MNYSYVILHSQLGCPCKIPVWGQWILRYKVCRGHQLLQSQSHRTQIPICAQEQCIVSEYQVEVWLVVLLVNPGVGTLGKVSRSPLLRLAGDEWLLWCCSGLDVCWTWLLILNLVYVLCGWSRWRWRVDRRVAVEDGYRWVLTFVFPGGRSWRLTRMILVEPIQR